MKKLIWKYNETTAVSHIEVYDLELEIIKNFWMNIKDCRKLICLCKVPVRCQTLDNFSDDVI